MRALEERRVRPVGSEQEIPVNARVVAATNRDLAQEVAAGRFRQDLYYRPQVMEIELPMLRERPEDIPELINHFTRQLAGQLGVPPVHPDAASLRRLQKATTGGQCARIAQSGRALADFWLLRPQSLSWPAPLPRLAPRCWRSRRCCWRRWKTPYPGCVFNACGGNKSEAARQLGVSRKTLDRKCNAWGCKLDHGGNWRAPSIRLRLLALALAPLAMVLPVLVAILACGQ